MRRERQSGVTLPELVVVVAIFGVLAVAAIPAMTSYFENQRVKSATRAVADAFHLARSEAIRTGNHHIAVFQGAMSSGFPVAVVDDGLPTAANCVIDAGEIVHSVQPEPGVNWGTTPALANGTQAPADAGVAAANVPNGSSFTDATRNPANPASAVLFQPDGVPRLFTEAGGACDAIGQAGEGGGAIYLTNGERDYAAVLTPLGGVRVHVWAEGDGAWKE